jgi:fatty acid desaturase
MLGYPQFRKDSRYLVKNNLLRIAVFAAAIAVLMVWHRPAWGELALFALPILLISTIGTMTTSLGWVIGAGIALYQSPSAVGPLVWIVTALLATFPVSGLYHNATHLSFRPRFLNRVVGEIVGLWHMSSIDEWSILHALHHTYADDLENDPHPPAGQSFPEFMKTTGKKIGASFAKHYVKTHGPEALPILKKVSVLILARQILASFFWFLALGPQLYIFLFATNIVAKKIHWAWFNWATHVQVEGKVQVLDLNRGLYRLINWTSLNMYMHGSHHIKPTMFRPRPVPQSTPQIDSKAS